MKFGRLIPKQNIMKKNPKNNRPKKVIKKGDVKTSPFKMFCLLEQYFYMSTGGVVVINIFGAGTV